MKLVFTFDNGETVSHEVFERTFTIGRSEDCRVALESEHFSREHCLIEFVDGDVFITDMNSKNGVFINHIRIPKKMKVKYDLKLPLYMGECFVKLDISSDLRDPDHLSLETHMAVAPEELYRPLDPPKRVPSRPRPPIKEVKQKRALDGKGLLIALVILAAAGVVLMNRNELIPRNAAKAEKRK